MEGYEEVNGKLNENNSAYKVCDRITQLLNENNSCYLDSLLIALFHKNNKLIYDIFFNSPINHKEMLIINKKAIEIRNELHDIYLFISNKKNESRYCKNIRKMFNDYKNIYQNTFPDRHIEDNNWQLHQSEPIQVLQFLNIIFNFPVTSQYSIYKWGTNDKLTKDKLKGILSSPYISYAHEKSIFMSSIDMEDLYEKYSVKIKDFYPDKINIVHFDNDNLWHPIKNQKYNTKIQKTSYTKSKLLFIHINRLRSNFEKIFTKVIPVDYIEIKNNKLELQSIIVHLGNGNRGHYICLIKCNKIWYEYNDLHKKLRHIGSLKDLVNHENGLYISNSTDMIYM